MEGNYLIAARDQLDNARIALINAVKCFQNIEGDFQLTIKELKENIGDLTIAIHEIESPSD